MNALYDILQLERMPENIAYLAVFYGAHVAVALFAARTLVVSITRVLGLYHPAHYHRWPRLPWRSFYRLWAILCLWYERVFLIGKRSTGGFSRMPGSLMDMYKPGKGRVILGRAYAFGMGLLQPMAANITRHLFMFAMTGAGKTTALVTILACWVGAAFIIDPKRQITRALKRCDPRRWFEFNPYHLDGEDSISINVFDCIKAAMLRDGAGTAVIWAHRIAEALIITPSGSRSPFFTDTARGFIAGVILHVLSYHDPSKHNLPFVRDLLTSGYRVFDEETGEEETDSEEAHALLLRTMRRNRAFDGAISGAASAMENASGETGGNIRATALEQTKWLDIPAVRAVLLETTIPLDQLKTRDDIVFSFVAPVFSIREELAPLARLVLNMMSYTFEAVKDKKGQCLTIVDELPSLGYNQVFEVLLPVARSYGISFLGIAQDVEILQKVYPKSWEGFIGNADCVYWMGSNHDKTIRYLSQILGRKSIIEKDRYSGRKFHREVQVMEPDQVGRFLNPNQGRIIVTRAGKRALRLVNEPYYKALPVWAYEPDPDHRETLPRRMTRKLLGSSRKSEPSVISPENNPQSKPGDQS